MITKQLKALLAIPSPLAGRPRTDDARPVSEARASSADRQDAAPARPPEVAAARPPEVSPVPAPAPEVAAARPPEIAAAPAIAAPSLVPEGMRHFKMHGTELAANAPPAGPVLPFGPAPPAHPPASPAPFLVPVGMRGFTSVTGTELPTEAPGGAVLPFSTALPAAPAQTLAALTPTAQGSASATQRTAQERHATSPALSLEQYASLCADLALAPDKTEALFAQHGLGDPEARRDADAFWRDRLARDPALYQRFGELYWQQRSRGAHAAGTGPHRPG